MEIDKLYKQYSKMIRIYLARYVNETVAEDLTQDVFVKASNNLEKFRGDSSIKTWIYRIATNVAKDFLKSKAFKASIRQVPILETELEEYDHFFNSNISIEDNFEATKMNECIKEFIHRLPINYSAVLVLSELEEMNTKEISNIMKLSIGTVKVRLHRARARLKKELEMGCNISTNSDNKMECERK